MFQHIFSKQTSSLILLIALILTACSSAPAPTAAPTTSHTIEGIGIIPTAPNQRIGRSGDSENLGSCSLFSKCDFLFLADQNFGTGS